MPVPSVYSPAIPSTTLASRFELLCRRRGVDCRVDAPTGAGGRGPELLVTPRRGEAADAVAIRGLDGESWDDRAGMERLARVVEAWVGGVSRH